MDVSILFTHEAQCRFKIKNVVVLVRGGVVPEAVVDESMIAVIWSGFKRWNVNNKGKPEAFQNSATYQEIASCLGRQTSIVNV